MFGWALTAEEKNNSIMQNVVHIKDQYNVKNDGIQGVSHSKEQVDLEEKFEKHERIILDMKEQIKKMHDEFFDALEPDSCVGKGNDVNEEEGCPSKQRKCDEGRVVLHTGKRVNNLISMRKMTRRTNQNLTIMETTKLLSLTLKVKVIHCL